MANIPLQSITFPGLSDKYTTPTVDATLTQTGAAADAKKTGDEISGLKNDFIHIKDRVGGTFSVTDLGTWAAGGLTYGAYNSSVYYRLSTTSRVYLEDGLTFTVQTGRRAVVHTVTSDGTFILDSGWIAGGTSYTIPANTYVMMMLSPTSSTSAAEAEYHATVAEYAEFAMYNISSEFASVAELDEVINGIDITWITGKALANNGTMVDQASYSTSEPIKLTDIVKGATFANIRQRISWTIAPICFYNASGGFIGYYTDASAGNNAPITVKISDILDNYVGAEYIRIGKENTDNVTVESNTISSISDRVSALETVYPAYNITSYPKILFCGDSVTYGYVVEGTQEDPSQIYQAMPDNSYPACFGRVYGNTCTVVAQSGITIKQFYETKYPSIDFSEYNMVIFELGLNPGNEGYLSIDKINDEGTSTYIYRQMIAGVRAQNSDIAIVLMRSQANIGEKGLQAIVYIANENNGYVIDLADPKYINLNDAKYHGWFDNNGTATYDGTHFSRVGYSAKAYDVIKWLGEVLPH